MTTLGVLLCSNAAGAAECGDNSPDYSARRSLTIGPETKVSKVYVAGFKVREEHDNADSSQGFVLRLPEQGVSYLVDPARKEALALPLPPRPTATEQATRQVTEKQPGGTFVRHFQLLSGDAWRDVTTTTCRSDGVMLKQEFYFVDQQGKVVNGTLQQSDVGVGALPKSLFEVPNSFAIKDPRVR